MASFAAKARADEIAWITESTENKLRAAEKQDRDIISQTERELSELLKEARRDLPRCDGSPKDLSRSRYFPQVSRAIIRLTGNLFLIVQRIRTSEKLLERYYGALPAFYTSRVHGRKESILGHTLQQARRIESGLRSYRDYWVKSQEQGHAKPTLWHTSYYRTPVLDTIHHLIEKDAELYSHMMRLLKYIQAQKELRR